MRFAPRYSSGFTLIEVILASCIFVLLACGVYFAVTVSVSSATALAANQIESRKVVAFEDFLRSGFLNLPPEAELSVRVRQGGAAGDRLELVIKFASGAFKTGAFDFQGSSVILQLAPDGKGRNAIAMTRFSERLDGRDQAEFLNTAAWLPLLEGVESLRWRFWDKNDSRYVETWDRGRERPPLVELSLKQVDEAERVVIFRVPELGRSNVAGTPNPPSN